MEPSKVKGNGMFRGVISCILSLDAFGNLREVKPQGARDTECLFEQWAFEVHDYLASCRYLGHLYYGAICRRWLRFWCPTSQSMILNVQLTVSRLIPNLGQEPCR